MAHALICLRYEDVLITATPASASGRARARSWRKDRRQPFPSHERSQAALGDARTGQRLAETMSPQEIRERSYPSSAQFKRLKPDPPSRSEESGCSARGLVRASVAPSSQARSARNAEVGVQQATQVRSRLGLAA
jgi:hypothetical protein